MSSLFGNGKESIQRNRISLASLLESIENADEDDKIVSPQGNEEVEAQEKTSSEENHIDSQNPKESSSPQENQDTKPSSGNPQATTSGLFFRFQANSPSVSQFFNNSQMSQASTGQPKENSEGSKPFFSFFKQTPATESPKFQTPANHQSQSTQNSNWPVQAQSPNSGERQPSKEGANLKDQSTNTSFPVWNVPYLKDNNASITPVEAVEHIFNYTEDVNQNLVIHKTDIWDVKYCIDPRAKLLLCTECKNLVIKPIVDYCGHLYCTECVVQVIQQNRICQISNLRIRRENLRYPDGVVLEHLQTLVFECPNGSECQWSGRAQEYDEHIFQCQDRKVKCPYDGCNKLVFYSRLWRHKEECPERKFTCNVCKSRFSWDQLANHRAECLEQKVVCRLGCRKSFPKSHDLQHTKYECPKRLMHCEYRDVGCKKLVAAECYEQHCKDDADEHRLLYRRHQLSKSK
eukprot:TRINITY_DN8398_c0_g2_i1.p1 TRINITY_DN8398_c0_g2~~TRINITY_DN8398_c0_g2_i1.p1  ORF type:complete len:461 (+),score=37.62 TRINITY_DN8398_c0_g2_i1:142-1524(+)